MRARRTPREPDTHDVPVRNHPVAGSAAVLTLAAGGGWLAALAVYSLGGSLTLMTATLLAMPGDRRRCGPPPCPGRRRCRAWRRSSPEAPQST